jgi:16S rRNA processing protein RimM
VSPTRLVAIAEIARPHGVAGELRAKLFNPESQLLARGRLITLELASGERRSVRISTARRANDAMLLRLDGVADRTGAEALRGARVLVERDAFPEAEEGEFYAVDVEGARAEIGGEVVGTVKRLVTYPACSAFEVVLTDGRTLEVPLTEAYVEDVDAEAGVVKLRTLEDLE